MNIQRLLPIVALALTPSWSFAQTTERLNLSGGAEANDRSINPECSVDGRFVVWQTLASNVVPGDTNGTWDVFLLDRQTGVTELVSRTSQGTPANGFSVEPSISDNGRYVAFRASAPDLVPGTNAGLYLYDRILKNVVLASPSSSHATTISKNPALSRTGRYVVFSCDRPLIAADTNARDDVYRYDRVTDSVELVSRDINSVQSTQDSLSASVSEDGRFVVFETLSSTWGAAFTGTRHIWRKDMLSGALECISTDSLGNPAVGLSRNPVLAADGSWAAFETVASNLVIVNGAQQIVAKNLVTGETRQVTLNDAGQPANNYSYEPEISADGRFVKFRSAANNFHMGGTNAYYSLFMRDLRLGITRKVSLTAAGLSNDEDCDVGDVSVTGRFIVFSSKSTSLVAGDTNAFEDIFLRDRFGDGTYTYGWSPQQSIGCLPYIEALGTPSASAGSGFDINLVNVRGAVPGILIYSKSGPTAIPVFGSNLYVAAPTIRTSVQVSSGTVGQCNGSFSFDFNSHVAGGSDGGLGSGTPVWAQYWSRDVGSSGGSHLSDALAFVLGV